MIEILLILIATVVTANFGYNVTRNRRSVATKSSKNEVLLDTCALIDGRVLELARTGFLPSTLIVPKFVIAELQGLADGRDSVKRERARDGLDMIKQLQQDQNVDVQIITDSVDDQVEVDDKLVALSKTRRAALFTTDYNLKKVAEIEGVTVLNVNELSQLLRPVHIPGETAQIKIIQKGQGKGQGVGYLDDGTMVVVENASAKVGKNVSIVFDKHLQTSAGKMMFAKIKK